MHIHILYACVCVYIYIYIHIYIYIEREREIDMDTDISDIWLDLKPPLLTYYYRGDLFKTPLQKHPKLAVHARVGGKAREGNHDILAVQLQLFSSN